MLIRSGTKNFNYNPFEMNIEGMIMKKGEIMGGWQQRFVRINNEGLCSYRNSNLPPTLKVPFIH